MISKLKLNYRVISFISFLTAVVSGIFLSFYYHASDAYISITKILLFYPIGNVIRNVHFWSAQLFLLSVITQLYLYLKKKDVIKSPGNIYLNTTIAVIGFLVMSSGFFLKADADSKYIYNMVDSIFQYIPYLGSIISIFFIGDENKLRITLTQHAALSVIFAVLFSSGKPLKELVNKKVIYITILICLLLGMILNAPLHDNIDSYVKGPWYFEGIQEIMLWIKNPFYFLIIFLVLFLFFFGIPFMQITHSLTAIGERHYNKIIKFIRKGLFISLVFYAIITLFAFFFRGENRKFEFPWNNRNIITASLNSVPASDSLRNTNRLAVLGRYEGCICCHSNVNGLSISHNVKTTGCQSCHAGNPFTLDKWLAHRKMILIPGNLSNANRTCGTANCHPDIIARVNNSLMNTMGGVVSIDKYVFGEYNNPSVLSDIKNIDESPSDKHLRNLCASCHLYKEKEELGPANESSRGGGCIACHLNYSAEAKSELTAAGLHLSHPDINLNASNDHCFGCHSRSGRISTSYEGWFETLLNKEDVKGKEGYRILADDRVFEKHEADVHSGSGMQCIDCHLSYEIMGDGGTYLHKEEQVKIQCEDCHSQTYQNFSNAGNFDHEAGKILNLRNWNSNNNKFLISSKAGYIFTNTYFDSNSIRPILRVKSTEKILPLKQPLDVCVKAGVHKRLTCNACHTSRASQCIGCHTEYEPNSSSYDLLDDKEVKGEWVEHSGQVYNELPVLGIRIRQTQSGEPLEKVETFIPGMVLRIDFDKHNTIYRRLYSPISAHTTVRSPRTCKSCHNNPVALGYGRGELNYQIAGNKGKWIFTPQYKSENFDGLPSDAWIGFMQNNNNNFSTRDNIRPFNVDEQKNILRIGSCLTCHEEDSSVMQRSLFDFQKELKNLSTRCILPE